MTTTNPPHTAADLADRAAELADLFTRMATDLRTRPRTNAELVAIEPRLWRAALATMSFHAVTVREVGAASAPLGTGEIVRYVGRVPAYMSADAAVLGTNLQDPAVQGIVAGPDVDGRVHVSWDRDGTYVGISTHRAEELARI